MSDKSSEMPEEMKTKRDEFGKERKQIMIDCGHHFTVGIVADQHVFLGFNKCFELMNAENAKLKCEIQESNDLIEHLRCKLESISDVRAQRNRFAEKINELKETIEELKKPLVEQIFYVRKKLENSNYPNTFVAIDALLNELDAISENEKMKAHEQKLLEVISVLKEACGFYGDADNWEKTSPLHYLKINNADLIIRDISLLAHIGGKTANEALAKVDEMMKELNK